MTLWHVDDLLPAYLHDALSPSQRQRVRRHLARCARCRAAGERLRAAHVALQQLSTAAAPATLWARVESRLGIESAVRSHRGGAPSGVLAGPKIGASGPRIAAAAATTTRDPRDARAGGISAQAGRARSRNSNPFAVFVSFVDNLPAPWRIATALAVVGAVLLGLAVRRQSAPGWGVRTLAGRPRVGWFALGGRGKLRVGESLTTDRASSAEIDVAGIGTVTIAPDSRVRLAATNASQHRLELQEGALEAHVLAPPRLFVVDTGAGRAVDLGCAYRLRADGGRSTHLTVTVGEVALEEGGRSSLVPMGFSCESRRSGGLGAPVRDGASERLRLAVARFDYEAGGDGAAEAARAAAGKLDPITLWHLLRRCSPAERGRLFDTMAAISRPPRTVTREGIVAGDTAMLDDWKDAILYDLAEAQAGS
ncbi:MAG TPA: zf-HC2 domain-containing protein [Chthonomonadaceae bacterium]|nr:zf-HC2 domain-containing protein [Chthonomonadaceae bacterium]